MLAISHHNNVLFFLLKSFLSILSLASGKGGAHGCNTLVIVSVLFQFFVLSRSEDDVPYRLLSLYSLYFVHTGFILGSQWSYCGDTQCLHTV